MRPYRPDGRRLRLTLAALLFAGVAAGDAGATTPGGLTSYNFVAISSAGDQVASVDVREPFAPTTVRPRGPVVVRAIDGTRRAVLDPCPTCRYSGLAWSPDGASLAFVASDEAAGSATLEMASHGRVRALARIEGLAETPRWSPDGSTLAVLATPGAHKQTGAVEAGAEQVGEIGESDDEKRIAVVPVTGGAIRYVSPADTFVYEYDWTPDGRGFVATAAKGNGDDNWWIAKLIGVDRASGAARVIAAPRMQMNDPRVSPDGRTVAFIGGLMSDFGSVGGDVYTLPIQGGEPLDATPGVHATFTSILWRGAAVDATRLRGDRAEITRLDLHSGEVSTLWSAPAGDADVSLDAAGRVAAFMSQDFEHPPTILAGPLPSGLHAIADDNAGLAPQVAARSVTWRSDGFNVQGWLLAPLSPAPGKHPMVVVIHGGPSAAATPQYVSPYPDVTGRGPDRDLVARGYYVFQPNPRGSYGQGEAFTRANVRDFGGGDLRDILAGVDAVEASAPVDDARLGVFGHSYGGFMTMWTVTHSHRFRAAVAGAGLSDWISYYGENGIDQWMIPFFGASVYDDPAIYEKASPILSIKDARTPTFIYVGERDVECPAPQSFEFWHGLRAQGVPTSLVVYAGQGHAIRNPADLDDLRRREIAWFDKYLQP